MVFFRYGRALRAVTPVCAAALLVAVPLSSPAQQIAVGHYVLTDLIPGSVNGITAGPDGALWFAQSGDIGRITTAGTVTEYHYHGRGDHPVCPGHRQLSGWYRAWAGRRALVHRSAKQ